MVKKVLIIDGSGGFSFNLARSLIYCKDYDVHLLELPGEKNLCKLKHINRHTIDSYADTEHWLDSIERVVRQYNIDLIVAGEEKSIDFLIVHQSRLSAYVQLPPLPLKKHFDIARNKAHLSEFISANSLSQPKTFLYKNDLDFSVLTDFSYPILIKPSAGLDGVGIEKFADEASLKARLQCNDFAENITCQEYIAGRDICISVLCEDGNIIAYTIQQSLIDNTKLYASSLAHEFLQNKNVLHEATQLMKLLNWQGVAHVDMRINESTGQVYILEINPRFWGSLISSLAAGVNFSFLYCQLSMKAPVEYISYKNIQFMKIKTVLECLLGKHKLRSPLRLFSLRTGLTYKFYSLRRWLSIQS